MQRAALVLHGEPSDDLAWHVALKYGDDDVESVAWESPDEVPEWVAVDLRDQLTAHHRDADDSRYVVIFFGTSEEIDSLVEDGE